jgi:DNA polymerase-3 subunit alpha
MVTRFRVHTTKTGKTMGFVTLEDIQGNLELVVFPNTWKKYSKLVEMDRVLLIQGQVDTENNEPKVLVDKMEGIEATSGDLEMGANLPVQEAGEPMVPRFESAPAWEDDMPPPPPEPDDWYMLQPAGVNVMEVPVYAAAAVSAAPLVKTADKPATPPPVPVEKLVVMPSFSSAAKESSTAQITPLSYIVPPVVSQVRIENSTNAQPRMLKVILRATSDKSRDARRIKNVHGMLRSCPGRDRFCFMVFESGLFIQIEFPNETTGVSTELVGKLVDLVGEENIQVETINNQ